VTSSLPNLVAYSVQLGVMVAAALVVMFALRVARPRASLLFWQLIFAVAILLPILQPRIEIAGRESVASGAAIVSSAIVPALGVRTADLDALVIYVVAAGVAARVLWLLVGLVRLRTIVSTAVPSQALQTLARELGHPINTTAAIGITDRVQTPATIGLRRPLILLPQRILEMPELIQRAVITHELVHVSRRDWLQTLLEELWCAVMWFHPAARMIASRLSLSRETVVDEIALRLTQNRRAYAEALLAFATPGRAMPGVTPFVGRRHLSQRISLITREDIMSRRRLLASFAIAVFACAAATVAAVTTLPMIALTAQSAKVYKPGDGISLPIVLTESKPGYTREAMQQGIQGSVFMAVVVLSSGDVGDVRVTQSLDAEYGLDQEAVKAAKTWKFKPGMKDGEPVDVEVTIQMTFTLK
jgi:TonB family protein